MRKNYYCIIVFFLLINLCSCGEQDGKLDEIRKIVKASEVPIYFLGKIIDQHSMPVQNAQVKIHLTYFDNSKPNDFYSGLKIINLYTDSNGIFKLDNKKGIKITVNKIHKDGYEYIRKWNKKRTFQYGDGGQGLLNIYKPQKDIPVIFRLRKRGLGTYLLDYSRNSHSIGKKPPFKFWCDFVNNQYSETDPAENKARIQFVPDIEVEVREGARSDVQIVLKTFGDNAGIIKTPIVELGQGGLIDRMLYKAPDTGYISRIKLIFSLKDFKTMYLYIKSREPAIYTRCKVDIMLRKDNLQFTYKTWTNPYGEMNLDEAENLPWELESVLKDEAIQALNEEKLPAKPDLNYLINEYKKREKNISKKVIPLTLREEFRSESITNEDKLECVYSWDPRKRNAKRDKQIWIFLNMLVKNEIPFIISRETKLRKYSLFIRDMDVLKISKDIKTMCAGG